MKKVYLSDSGPVISDSIYSFWRWSEEQHLDVSNIKEITNYCLELGINGFDLSNSYGLGKVEELFGKALASKSLNREDIVLFSKIGYKSHNPISGKITYNQLTDKYLNSTVENSLKQLNTDYIDVLLLKDYDPLMKADEVVSALNKLVYSGKVKHIGISDFNVFEHQLLSNLSLDIVTNHFELNLFNTSAVHDGRLALAKEKYVKPMAWAPLADGRILYGHDNEALAIRDVLTDIAVKYNSNVEQIAVSWIHKLGALPIIGSLNKERIKNAATASEIKLTHEDWHRIYNSTKK
ncbi:MAG: aldo/keto reductase [Flavobacteriia bacterium]|nr:aldo/keto reductase [Flavobacteriia bacterium]